ncbi:MAG: ABC transporter substrate-binding protein [Solirubrobacteraceae bacterium]
MIGAVIDESNFMSAFDDPALAAAQLEANKVNAAGGVDGHPLKFIVENDQLDAAKTKSDALDVISKGAQILWVTCDVDESTPSIQVGLSKQMLTVSPCIGTDQMGPSRFGPPGDLAFSFGNAARDEGSALAQLAIQKGWKTANVITDNSLIYYKRDCQAFGIRFKQLGGQVLNNLSFTAGDGTIGNVASKAESSKAAVNAICTASSTKELPTFLTDIRTVNDQAPVIGPWSLDGSFWLPKSPKIANNIWVITYASIYGDDPSPAVQKLEQQLKAEGKAPTTGGFVTGAAAVDGLVTAIKRAGGSTNGAKLAAQLVKFHNVPTISGDINFSSTLHSVFGREYRVIHIVNGKPGFAELIKADHPVTLP